ncbi:MAG TPA: MmgE/PrpD family protein [Vicinamibacterales bacterium]|jgi:2-methylcitrate dehydratase PrpD|nr:MmgE/PrpD family protein [Vicinamibacterales bacterium]
MSKASRLSRRRVLQGAGGLMAAAGLPSFSAADALPQSAARPAAPANITRQLARYMVEARDRDLPADIARETRHRILDTLGAIVSGAQMKPGEAAIRYVQAQGGTPEASVLTTSIKTSAVNAALANGMFGHADETDDFEPVTKAHPGCAVLPAALAVAEREGRSGTEVVRAVALGYDLCCRFLMALGPDHVRGTHRSAEGTSATFGAVAAAASLARLDERGMRHALSYAAQQVSGIWSWTRDSEHIEKAFDFGGMGARNGVTAALMVQSGFTGVDEVLDGEHNMIDALSTEPRPEQMIAGLGTRFFVTETAIKTFSVGYPIQAPLDALLTLRRQHGLTADNVTRIVARLPEDGARIVNDSAMPDVNCQYILAVGLIDGAVSFADSHSHERMKDPRVLAVKQRIELVADRALMDPDAPRSGRVEVTLRDGRQLIHFTRFAPGTKENPLDAEGVNAKVRDLMVPVVGVRRSDEIIRSVHAIETFNDMKVFVRLLTQA